MLNERMDQAVGAELLLSLQRALLGAVPASLRAVTCDWDEGRATLRCVFDGPVRRADREAMAAVGAAVADDFCGTLAVAAEIVQADHPAGLAPHALRAWAFLRREPPTEDTLVRWGAGPGR